MSDSLRDQLLQAGFNAPKKEAAKPKRSRPNKPQPASKKNRTGHRSAPSNRHNNQVRASTPPKKLHTEPNNQAQQDADADIAKRKAIKAQIKTLIEDSAIKEFQGESVYRFILNKRIRELHVKEEIREQLVAGTLIITRLNGSTWLVPEATSEAIRQLNPDWAVVTPAPDTAEDTSGYEDFPVPDDLQW